ncbi:MAG TPA: AAA family ATPase, partial [Pseudonocardia sp.]|nr:AAA family ATPase [Pseudonocardia sp.]
MTDRETGPKEYPEGSVGRYVREAWGDAAVPGRGRRGGATPAPPARPAEPQAPSAPAGGEETPAGDASTPPRPSAAVAPSEGSRPAVEADPRTSPAGIPVTRPVSPADPAPPVRGTARWVDPGAVAARDAQRARSDSEERSPADLSSARLLRPSRRPPQSGWRRVVYVLSGRLINLGESPADVRRRELTARVNKPLLGCHKIAMLSLKGGVGKTTVTATLGATFASLRGDRVVAVDANPDRGTLSQRIPLETTATVRHLLRDAQRVRRYTDVRAYTSQGPSRLEVLASEQDPAVSDAFSEEDYRRTVALLEHFYNIVLTDCGTGL